jgi:hypothetical protein
MSDPASFTRTEAGRTSVEVIQPPANLRARLGPRFGRIDPGAIAKAEAALKGLSSQFGQWLQDEVGKLEAARADILREGLDSERADRLYTHAHDLKGLGSTYEYPIVTRIAASLCKLLGEGEQRLRAPLPLVDAHVNAIRAAVRDGVKDSDTPVGAAVTGELEKHVADILPAIRG